MERFLKPGWLALYALALAGLAWFAGPRVLRRIDFFRVRRVELVGVENLGQEELLRGLGLGRRANLFDDLAPIERRARQLPGVAEASVSRRLPGTLVVEIAEVPPVALVPGRAGLAAMDAAGRLLPFDPSVAAPDLPLATRADPLVGRLLGQVLAADPALFAQVSSADRDGNWVVLSVGKRRLVFRPDASMETIRAVTAVAQDLARLGRPWQELDGRWAGQVIVRGGSA
ncbi:MAG TPA: FtsQ-type POTRA domain-containing protein [Gemmatimonadales bacterium]|nr:FtsQ-type POTRA domain-containing protein [Gemmatimonadales bacterium]